MTIKIVPEDYVSVRVAAERSGYSRAHIHNLANWDVVRSEMVTDNFRLVSWEDIVAYMNTKGRPVPQPEPLPEAAS